MDKLNIGDPVFFYDGIIGKSPGKIEVVDSYGTFEQSDEPSYDIGLDYFEPVKAHCLMKHIRESEIIGVMEG